MSFEARGQVEISKETTKDKQKKEKKKERDSKEVDGTTSVFVTANWSYTTRKLIENDGYFGDSLGERANETGIGNWSFDLGFRNQLNKSLMWEGGVSFMQNGEQYSFEQPDSSYNYQTKYMYIAVPLKLYYTYGSSVKLLAGAGVVPQMFMRYRQNIQYTTSEGDSKSDEVKTKSGYNSFVLSAVFNLGVEIELSKSWSAIILPEYKLQLNSTYNRNDSYKHYGRSLGVSFGFALKL